MTGLNDGTRYYFRVYARTSRATSPSSNIVNAIPRTKPSAPRSATAAPTNLSGQVRLEMGCAVVERRLGDHRLHHPTVPERHELDQHQRRKTSTATAYTVAGLTNGARYYFRIVAKNAAGTSPTSAAVSAIPRTVPSVPTGLHGRSDPHGYFLDWEVPASNGGTAITGYVLDYSNGLHWVRIGDGFPTITQDYVTGRIGCVDFRVAATNGVGAGPSATSTCASPGSRPFGSDRRCDRAGPRNAADGLAERLFVDRAEHRRCLSAGREGVGEGRVGEEDEGRGRGRGRRGVSGRMGEEGGREGGGWEWGDVGLMRGARRREWAVGAGGLGRVREWGSSEDGEESRKRTRSATCGGAGWGRAQTLLREDGGGSPAGVREIAFAANRAHLGANHLGVGGAAGGGPGDVVPAQAVEGRFGTCSPSKYRPTRSPGRFRRGGGI